MGTTSIEQANPNYWQMARDYMRETGCRWAEACLEIKRRYPESRESFGAPPLDPRRK